VWVIPLTDTELGETIKDVDVPAKASIFRFKRIQLESIKLISNIVPIISDQKIIPASFRNVALLAHRYKLSSGI